MWKITPTSQFQRDIRWYEKKRPDELAAVSRNLERYLALLNVSKNSKCVEAGYLHKEPAGVVAIDQKGSGANLQETRLYTFASDQTRTVHLITMGSKDEQHSDIELSRQFVKNIEQQGEDSTASTTP